MKCNNKHTKIQIPDSEFKCPKCGATPTGHPSFVVDVDVGSDLDCDLLHDLDVCVCGGCDRTWSGKSLVNLYIKGNSMTKCETCCGTGWIKKAKDNEKNGEAR